VSDIKLILDNLQFFDVVLINVLIQAPFIYGSWRLLRKSGNFKMLLPLSIINSIVVAMLLQPTTVVKNDFATDVQHVIDQHKSNGFPIPSLSHSIRENSENGMTYFKKIGVLNLYNKKVGRVDYRITPSNLLNQNTFWFDTTLSKVVLGYPLVYKADSAAFTKNATALTNEKKYVFVESASLADRINNLNKSSTGGSRISITEFLPTRLTMNIVSSDTAYYVLLQNFFPAWNVHMDNFKLKPELVNRTFMGFMVPPGSHIVQFIFEPFYIRTAWWISLLALFGVICYRIRYIFP
jgi:hypothetical protein